MSNEQLKNGENGGKEVGQICILQCPGIKKLLIDHYSLNPPVEALRYE